VLDDRGIQRRAAVTDALRGIEEVVDIENAILQQVAEPAT
jgi:hypothetical protein